MTLPQFRFFPARLRPARHMRDTGPCTGNDQAAPRLLFLYAVTLIMMSVLFNPKVRRGVYKFKIRQVVLAAPTKGRPDASGCRLESIPRIRERRTQ